MNTKKLTVIAIVAHPDDIEFRMAGTLLLLKDVGADIHLWNLANGCLGTTTHSYNEIIRIRWEEAQASAREIGATIYPPIVDDFAIMYNTDLLARVSAVVRLVKPDIVFTHPPQDYMEDHTNACRLAVSGAFARGMPNYATIPPTEAWSGSVTIYHSTPHGLRDNMRRLARPGQYVDTSMVLARQRSMLAQHRSQKEWLDVSQGMDSYLTEMENFSRLVGKMSGRFEYAEGWWRHSHQGYAPHDADPLGEALGDKCWTDPEYQAALG